MKRGHLAIALFLVGIIAIIGIVGFSFIKNQSPSGAYAGYYGAPRSHVLGEGTFPWEDVYGITYDLYLAETYCPYHTINEARGPGFIIPGNRQGRDQFQCLVVPFSVVPVEYIMKLRNLVGPYYNWWPVVCFLQGGYEKPEEYDYPFICHPPTRYPFIPQ